MTLSDRFPTVTIPARALLSPTTVTASCFQLSSLSYMRPSIPIDSFDTTLCL
jgi:hypothetical protein